MKPCSEGRGMVPTRNERGIDPRTSAPSRETGSQIENELGGGSKRQDQMAHP